MAEETIRFCVILTSFRGNVCIRYQDDVEEAPANDQEALKAALEKRKARIKQIVDRLKNDGRDFAGGGLISSPYTEHWMTMDGFLKASYNHLTSQYEKVLIAEVET